MRQRSRAFLKIRLNHWSLVATILLAIAYYSLLETLRHSTPPESAQVYMSREARSIGQPQLRSHAAAWDERQQLEPSIRSLERIKYPSPQQQRQLQQLKERYRVLSRIEDHELRLSLRGHDSTYYLEPTRAKLKELRRAEAAME